MVTSNTEGGFSINLKQRMRYTYLGGMTGSGKTRILHELRALGQQVIDLEELAQHRGSSFGSMNKLVQPTQEQFENNLASELNKTRQATENMGGG